MLARDQKKVRHLCIILYVSQVRRVAGRFGEYKVQVWNFLAEPI